MQVVFNTNSHFHIYKEFQIIRNYRAINVVKLYVNNKLHS
jgi:hypothetical protein